MNLFVFRVKHEEPDAESASASWITGALDNALFLSTSPQIKMTTNKKNNLAEYGGQKPKQKHFTIFSEVCSFVKYSDLKDIDSQKHVLIFVAVDDFIFFSFFPQFL